MASARKICLIYDYVRLNRLDYLDQHTLIESMITIKYKGVTQAPGAKIGGKAGAKPHPTAARVRELLDYDPKTDTLRWKVSRGRAKAGSMAGSPDFAGNLQIRIDGRLYMAKQLARTHVSGVWVRTKWHDRKFSRQYKG